MMGWMHGILLLALCYSTVALASAREGLPDFTGLVQEFSPAVVNIATTQTMQHPRINRPPLNMPPDVPEGPLGDLFRHFFGDEFGGGDGGLPDELQARSLGSGFIISKDGYVLTNYHVVAEADEIIVRLSDRRELVAKVVGSDKKSDIALLKIDTDNLPVVRMARDKILQVGEWVLAIGSPFGFDHSVTAGIVSAIGRSLPRENYVPFIQTDVAINPGNSGGPLFDLDGNVVGINSQIFSRTGGFMGLSFAIPIDVAMDVADQLKTSGHVSRGWLGVLIQDVTRELAESFKMDKPEGALVSRVLPDSPAEKAGFKVGDVITAFDGKPVSTSASLPPMVGMVKAGAKVKVTVIRNGKAQTLLVKIGELPEDEVLKLSSAKSDKVTGDRLGLVVEDLTDELRKRLEVDKNGVLVTQVSKGPASQAGLQRGDVILMLNNTEIKDAESFGKMVKDLPGGTTVRLLVQRQGAPTFMVLRMP
ncbi:MAG: serine peptidase [Gammaproteobacteria bacterium RBG_16_57_12]|nr:MAG: serine peptidase [Gammaproteobacteria bacterium RBG_16_57_12]